MPSQPNEQNGLDRVDDAIEHELKFADADLSGLTQRLEELEAERVSTSSLEDNWVFDRGDELRSRGRLLRLRVDARGAQLTFKGPTSYRGRAKVRTEHQTRVEDAAQARRLIESLGYEEVRRYQKKREEWRLGGVVIALDHTPIGDFVEFEGAGAETVARRCSLDPENAETRSYLQLYEDYRKGHPGAPADMVFP